MSKKPQAVWPDPKWKDLESEDFNAVWECIKSWDINVPEFYDGYTTANGNHVMAILIALGLRDRSGYQDSSPKLVFGKVNQEIIDTARQTIGRTINRGR